MRKARVSERLLPVTLAGCPLPRNSGDGECGNLFPTLQGFYYLLVSFAITLIQMERKTH